MADDDYGNNQYNLQEENAYDDEVSAPTVQNEIDLPYYKPNQLENQVTENPNNKNYASYSSENVISNPVNNISIDSNEVTNNINNNNDENKEKLRKAIILIILSSILILISLIDVALQIIKDFYDVIFIIDDVAVFVLGLFIFIFSLLRKKITGYCLGTISSIISIIGFIVKGYEIMQINRENVISFYLVTALQHLFLFSCFLFKLFLNPKISFNSFKFFPLYF